MPELTTRSSPRLTITSSMGDYDVLVGVPGGLENAMSEARFVVVDAAVVDHLPSHPHVLVVDVAESTKTLSGCEDLIVRLREAGVRRGESLLAVGGGVVQDVVTFVASVYMRGIPWVYVPTTLMAMADSCIGGKSSINVGDVKNLVGTFHPPSSVVVDERFLGTLSPPATSAGLAEAAKIAYCRGPEAFAAYLDLYDDYAVAPLALIQHVLDCKRWFVEVDEHDKGERLQLNFGHTFGHAFEVACGHRTSHGAAVAVGILCAVNHPASAHTPAVDQLANHCRDLLASVDLKPALQAFDATAFERSFRSDKKHTRSGFRLILPVLEGGVRLTATPDDVDGWSAVAWSVQTALSSLAAS